MKICANCQRYVQNSDESCPFCKSVQLSSEPIASGSSAGLSRARVFAARAVIVSAALGTAAACADGEDNDDNMTASGGSHAAGGAANSGGSATSSGGAQLASGGASEQGSGGNFASGGDGGDVGIPIYGGPFPDMMKARV